MAKAIKRKFIRNIVVKGQIILRNILGYLPFFIRWNLRYNYYLITKKCFDDQTKHNYEISFKDDKDIILVVDRFIPTPDEDSGSFRMNEIIKILTKKYIVIFLPADLKYDEKNTALLKASGTYCINFKNVFEVGSFHCFDLEIH